MYNTLIRVLIGGVILFCKFCGKEIEEGAKFCPSCGKNLESKIERKEISNTMKEIISDTSETIQTTNIFCIVSTIVTIISLFVNPYGIVGFGALLFSIVGYRGANLKNEKGSKIAIMCICGASIISLIALVQLCENGYNQSVINSWLDYYL